MSDYNNMASSQRASVCGKEQSTIKNILEANEMNMTSIVEDKVKVLYALNAQGPLNIDYKLNV